MAAAAIVVVATRPVSGQAPASPAKPAAAKKWTAPRTPDGQPDLQGFWTNSSYVPLERPENVQKANYTEQEFDAVVKAAAQREAEQTEPGTIADVHYDFSQFGLDRSQSALVRNLRTSLIVDPPSGRLPPVTAEGQKRAADRAAERRRLGATTDQVQNMPIGTRCLIMAGSGPPMMSAGYNSNYQIIQSPGYVMILVEMIHDARIIPIDGKAATLPDNMRQWMGDSRGHWEGDTLVIETTNFNGKNPFRGASERMKVTERLTRVDADTIGYKFTVEDPATWATPWTADAPLTKSVGPIFEHACHEGNYGVMNTLAGARLEDKKKAAEGAAKKGVN
jgi:hypothetical protein